MADLKISQFTDGGAIQTGDEIATNRSGVNTKVFVGSAAALDAGSGVGDVVVLQDDGAGNPQLPSLDASNLYSITITGLIEAGSNVSITGDGTLDDPYVIESSFTDGVTSANNIADNSIVRGDGGTNGIQGSGVTIDDSNNIAGANQLLLGSTTALTMDAITPYLQVIGTTAVAGGAFVRFSSANAPNLILGRSISNTIGTYTAVTTGTNIGNLSWRGADGLDLNGLMGNIRVEASSNATSNNLPARMVFSVNAGGNVTTDRMTIESNGGIVLDGATGGSMGAGTINSKGYFINGVAASQDYTLLQSSTFSTAASFDITTIFTNAYQRYVIELYDVYTSTANQIQMQVSTNNGSSFLTSGYLATGWELTNSGGTVVNPASPTTACILSGNTFSIGSSSTTFTLASTIEIINPSNAARYKNIRFRTDFSSNTGGNPKGLVYGSITNSTISALNAFRFLTNTGTMTGAYKVWGVK